MNDKTRLPPEEKPGIIYQITRSCSASYIGETGNSLFHTCDQYLSCLNRYNNAVNDLNGTRTRRRARPIRLEAKETTHEAAKGSALVEHASRCDDELRLKILTRTKFRTREDEGSPFHEAQRSNQQTQRNESRRNVD
ncbi:hypothetical protein M514_00101 [Trichuris suis]|uniref:Uncharacterized protein n=1 Tax=Trichuris suis TaxID=68888 RepID=A0A085MNZ2_9BILA|nr:hypothetical protein M513_00101 [Trichuris suis]KFD72967.1 hypothetical protein M514_00101 [Trichuris suis]